MTSSRRLYAGAVLASGLALLLTLLIDDPLTEPNTLLVFLAAVMCSSWYGGFGPGLLATTLTTLAFIYFYLPPAFSIRIGTPAAAVRLVEYVAVCVLVSVLNELRRRLHQRAQAARLEAEAANRAKDDFLATVSHDLRTPLSAIIGWTEILRTCESGMSSAALDSIERNAKAEARLVEDLLDLSRITRGQLRLDVRPIDLAAVIESSIETMRPALNAKEIELLFNVSGDAAFVSGDVQRLQRVFWNLLSNALKFTPERGRIEIRLEYIHSHAQIIVRDTGLGMDPEFLPYAFDRFRQATGGESRKHGGLGLGLSIARHLVELHGGTIRAESAGLGRGATFTVELPIISEHIITTVPA